MTWEILTMQCPGCGKESKQLYKYPRCGRVSCRRCADALFAKKCPSCKSTLDKKKDRL